MPVLVAVGDAHFAHQLRDVAVELVEPQEYAEDEIEEDDDGNVDDRVRAAADADHRGEEGRHLGTEHDHDGRDPEPAPQERAEPRERALLAAPPGEHEGPGEHGDEEDLDDHTVREKLELRDENLEKSRRRHRWKAPSSSCQTILTASAAFWPLARVSEV